MANLVTFVKKLWKDATSGGTPITAAELNRMEGGINDCATKINKLGDSVSLLYAKNVHDIDNPPNCLIFSTAASPNGLPNNFNSNSALVIQQNPGSNYAAQLAFSFGGIIALRARYGSMKWSDWKYLTPQ